MTSGDYDMEGTPPAPVLPPRVPSPVPKDDDDIAGVVLSDDDNWIEAEDEEIFADTLLSLIGEPEDDEDDGIELEEEEDELDVNEEGFDDGVCISTHHSPSPLLSPLYHSYLSTSFMS